MILSCLVLSGRLSPRFLLYVVGSCLVLWFCLALSCGRVCSCVVVSYLVFFGVLSFLINTYCAHPLLPGDHYLSLHSLVVLNMAMALEDAGPASGKTSPPTERYALIFYCCMICTINIPPFIHPSLISITLFTCLFVKWDTAGLYH